MKLDLFMRGWAATRGQNRMLFGSVSALSLVVLMQTFALLGRDRVVVLVPPELSAETEIARNRAGKDYTKAWGLHVATLIGNVTPGNGDFIKTEDQGHDRHGCGIPDLERSFQTGCDNLLCRPAFQTHGSPYNRMAEVFWLTGVS